MSKYPEYQHTKSREWFDRALRAIPSGVYGHLGPSEGLFLPLEKWPLNLNVDILHKVKTLTNQSQLHAS